MFSETSVRKSTIFCVITQKSAVLRFTDLTFAVHTDVTVKILMMEASGSSNRHCFVKFKMI